MDLWTYKTEDSFSAMLSNAPNLCSKSILGADKISAMLMRECVDFISGPICDIFKKYLNSGVFPRDWKSARVTPLFKQGERTDLNNYYPISVISVVAKVFENSVRPRIVYDQKSVICRTKKNNIGTFRCSTKSNRTLIRMRQFIYTDNTPNTVTYGHSNI